MLRAKCVFFILRNLTMSSKNVFVPRINPVTGESEWIPQNENYDYYQEIARSAYADMLHDTERNKKYELALKKAIDRMHSQGKPANVLDIGTGTGLLSMMAARHGADSITACEAFHPMAKCAKEVIKTNGFEEKINLISKRSTEITVGPGGDMPHRANILVTEVFDTELIGEGGLGTFHHAHQVLLEDDCTVVPTSANVYAQVVNSDFVRKWNTIQPLDIPGHMTIQPPQEITKYDGTASLHDLQLDQISTDLFQPITDPVCIFRFDFSGKTKIEFQRWMSKLVETLASGRCDAIFMWWDLQMDVDGDVLLSCAPRWAHPEPQAMQWRDHWMQAIFYPSNVCNVEKGGQVLIHSIHDEYSWWFDVRTPNDNMNNLCKEIPAGSSGLHLVCSRPRLGMLNDCHRREAYIGALRKVIKEDSICLCVSDGSQLPLIAAALGAKKVYVTETSPASRTLSRDYVKSNNLDSVVTILDKSPGDITQEDLGGNKITLCMAEPYFYSSLLHWHNLYFWYSWSHLSDLMVDSVTILPRRAILKAAAMEFDNLWKIRAPVGNCEGFDLGQFDQLIEKACDISDDSVEPQPLWEYPGTAVSTPFTLLELDMTTPVSQITHPIRNEGTIALQGSDTCHGVAIWMEYDLDDDHTVCTGPRGQQVQPGVKVNWDYYTRQGVHLFKTPVKVTSKTSVTFSALFNPSDGDVKLTFNVIKEDSICLCVSDGSQLPLIAAALGAKKVYVTETSPASRTLSRDYVKSNNLDSVVTILDKSPGDITQEDLGGNKITLFMAEPYFYSSLLHWHNLYFWYSWSHLSDLMVDSVTILPRRAILKAVAMEFDNLWKIRAPVGNCEGFDLGQFDQLIEKACDISDDSVEPQPLWEYPGTAVSTPFTLLELDMTTPVSQITHLIRNEGTIALQGSDTCHGVAIWMEYDLDDDHTVCTGPRGQQVQPGVKVNWDYYTRQGVHLFKTPVKVTPRTSVTFSALFNPSDGDVKLNFNV
ncbi:protein arginine N-methyltransferase 7 [Lingula anatina]|uniref:Protein arginine N-methyltransferase 7 n=1 Tax=Lingula anatina TaxID=7574 RepID=A0A1S3J5G5_LINAN|nr:protein arginine N-methyltransferase 7 [Lingula anatina]|eukprot:XP_013405662.1 protein arginine N-methyltransferase 7 [Lingula anatina]